MKGLINELEKVARTLEPHPKLRSNWTTQVHDYAGAFIDSLEHRKAYLETEDKGKGILDYPFSDQGRRVEELIHILHQHVAEPGLAPASGGHLGYIPGGGVYPTALGDYLAAVTNEYAGIYFAGPGAVRIENMLIRWMCQLVGFPETALGNLTSGGSIANLVAITTARDALGISSKKVSDSVIYLTHQAHHSLQKAIRIAGLGEAKHVYIDLDEHFRMDARALEKAMKADKAKGLTPFLVCASAGTTDTGAIDPMDDIAAIAQKQGAWFHVDAAYGGFFILADEVKNDFKGIEKADSVTIDPHKGLFLAYGLGAVLIKDVETLQNTHYYKANYMQDVIDEAHEPSPADLSPELTKHFRGLRLWLPLQLYGLAPFKAALREKLWLCRYFYQEVQKLGFEVGPEPELSVMIYRYVPEHGDANAFNAKLIEEIRKDGRVFLSSTSIDGVYWLRLAVLSFRTHMDTIEKCLEVLKEKVQYLEMAQISKS